MTPRRMVMSIISLLVLVALIGNALAKTLNPVILMPGDGGSRVEARLNKSSVVHYLCTKKSDWFDLWLNLEEMVPEIIDCWADNMKLIYDPKTRTTKNNDGVETRIPGFGNSTTVEYLDPSQTSYSVYFAKVVEKLIPLGYQRGVNLHGAPYDFRKAANEQGFYFSNLKKLVESTYEANGKQKVIFICHSMGSPMTLIFLNRQSQSWKDKYVKAVVTMAGVWAGTVRALKVYAIGDNLGAWIVSQKSLMVEQRTNPSLAWLMPSDKYWKDDEILVLTDKLNITSKNLTEFYKGIGHPEGAMIYQDVKDLNGNLDHPGVDIYCLHGSKVPTTEQLIYAKFPESTPVIKKGDGDGTVNIRSLLACTKWQNSKKKFHHKVFPHVDHLSILRNPNSTEYVKNIVQSLIEDDMTLVKDTFRQSSFPEIELIP